MKIIKSCSVKFIQNSPFFFRFDIFAGIRFGRAKNTSLNAPSVHLPEIVIPSADPSKASLQSIQSIPVLFA